MLIKNFAMVILTFTMISTLLACAVGPTREQLGATENTMREKALCEESIIANISKYEVGKTKLDEIVHDAEINKWVITKLENRVYQPVKGSQAVQSTEHELKLGCTRAVTRSRSIDMNSIDAAFRESEKSSVVQLMFTNNVLASIQKLR